MNTEEKLNHLEQEEQRHQEKYETIKHISQTLENYIMDEVQPDEKHDCVIDALLSQIKELCSEELETVRPEPRVRQI